MDGGGPPFQLLRFPPDHPAPGRERKGKCLSRDPVSTENEWAGPGGQVLKEEALGKTTGYNSL